MYDLQTKVRAKLNESREAQGSHDEVYNDCSKMNETVGAAAVINCYFQDGGTTHCQLSKRLTDNSTIFAAEAATIALALNYYYWHMGSVHHDVVVYSVSRSCLQVIGDEDTENPYGCHIMKLLWLLSAKGTRVRFYWIPSHSGIKGNERVDQLAKRSLIKTLTYWQVSITQIWRQWSTLTFSSWFKPSGM